MNNIGLHIGHYNLAGSKSPDLVRIGAGNYKATEKAMIRRKNLHAQKKGYISCASDKNYCAGMH